jgi:hypothetical protein
MVLNGGFIDPTNRLSIFDDFLVDTLATDWWLSTVEADATDQTTIAISEAAGGTVLMSLGSTANDFGNLASAKVFSTSKAGRVDFRLKVTTGAGAIDNLVVGLTDAKTESNGNLITNFSTPTIVPDDALLLGSNGTNWYMASANNTVDTATLLSAVAAPSATYQKLSIEWNPITLQADYYVDDVHVGSIANAFRTGQILGVIIAATHVGGTGDPIITVDYVHINQERA